MKSFWNCRCPISFSRLNLGGWKERPIALMWSKSIFYHFISVGLGSVFLLSAGGGTGLALLEAQSAKPAARSPSGSSTPSNVSASDFPALKEKAEKASDNNQLPEAIKLYQQLVRLRPDWAEGWWYLGTLQYSAGKFAEASQGFKKHLLLEPKNGQAWGMLGLCEFQLKQMEMSLRHLTKARELGLGGNDELARAVRYHQAVLFNGAGQSEAALSILRGFAIENRESAAVLEAMGMSILRIRGMANELSASQREMVREFGKMTFLEEQSKFDESFQLAVALEEKYRGQPNVAYAFGLSLVARSEAEKALPYFQQELSHNPRHVQSLLQLAFQLILLSRFEESIQYSQRATGVEPDNFAGYYALGQGYLYLNNLPSAILNLEKATTLEPDSSSAFYTLWQAYQRANRPADAARARAEFERLDELAKKMRGEAIAGAPPSTPEPPASPAP